LRSIKCWEKLAIAATKTFRISNGVVVTDVVVVGSGVVVVVGGEVVVVVGDVAVVVVGVAVAGFEELQDKVKTRGRLINASPIITKPLAIPGFVDPILFLIGIPNKAM
jgi:hypothetical protein